MVRRGIPLRWRISILTSVAIAALSVIAAFIAFWVVRSSLITDLQRSLNEDAARLSQVYSGDITPDNNDLLRGPTGGVIIQLYDPQGKLFAASSEAFEDPELAAIKPEVVMTAREKVREWKGVLAGRTVQASLAPFTFGSDIGIVAVVATTSFIGTALGQLAKTLSITTIILIIISSMIGYVLAASAIRPITQLAELAAKLDPNNLQTIPYEGPHDEVSQLNDVLNDLIERLRASFDAQRSFLAETSHELRTPLTSLQGFLDRAVRRANPDVQRDLSDARRIAQTMSRLVADLLQLSRGELVRELILHLTDPYEDVLKPVAEEYPGVNLTGQAGSVLVADPERLRQLIRNLTANAVRATGDPTKVELKLITQPTQSILEVSDQGPGIPPDALPHIFDKFYKGAGGGAGLGLAIAKQIADNHGGTLEVESTPEKGTTFRLSLPTLDDSDESI